MNLKNTADVISNAKILIETLKNNFKIFSGGTDTHPNVGPIE